MVEKEVESSLTYDLHPGDIPLPCRSVLTAPDANGFIVRLHKPKVKKSYETTQRIMYEAGRRLWNDTSCPLEIVSKIFVLKKIIPFDDNIIIVELPVGQLSFKFTVIRFLTKIICQSSFFL